MGERLTHIFDPIREARRRMQNLDLGRVRKNVFRRETIPYVVFFVIGAWVSRESYGFFVSGSNGFWSSITSDFAAAILTVVILQALWGLLGGDPLQNAIARLSISMELIQDLKGMGFLRFLQRREINLEERIEERASLARKAREFDLMGLTLWTEWFQDEELSKELVIAVKEREGTVRILLSNPDLNAPATSLRLKTSGEKKKQKLFQGLLDSTTEQIKELLDQLSHDEKKRFVVKVTDDIIYCSVIRMGNMMFVTNYTNHSVGNSTPAFQIGGEGTRVYEFYKREFDTMFTYHGKTWPGP